MKKSFKKNIGNIIRIMILIIGILILLYPTISNYLYEKNSSGIVSNYNKEACNFSDKEKERMLDLAKEYNEKLAKNQNGVGDAFSSNNLEDSDYNSLLNAAGDGMMGYIRIPKIDLELPIYHGTKESVLQIGIGHLKETSLPIGGKSTHAVLTGHRGLPSKLLFTDLDQVKNDDIVYIHILDKVFAYQIDRISVVLPSETESLEIEKDRDFLTLVTCTPYGINSHRLLVKGHRIPYNDAIMMEDDEVDKTIKIPFEVKVLLIALFIILTIFIFINLYRKNKKMEEIKNEKI